MGCNCGKNRRRPLGKGGAAERDKAEGRKPADNSQAGIRSRTNSTSTGRRQSFALRTTDGRTAFFGSRLEAEAARVRTGGGGSIIEQ